MSAIDINSLITFFQNVMKWADANGHGNSHGVLLRVTRDLETLRSLPPEAFMTPEVDSPPETDVNSGDSSTSDE